MSDEKTDRRFKLQWSLKSLIIATLTAGALLGVIVFAHRAERQLTSEYLTASVIDNVKQYAAEHHGDWPSSWEAIGISDQRTRDLVEVDFDLNSWNLIDNKELIYTSIQPKSHMYRTYPHAKKQLEDLWTTVWQNLPHIPNG
jgi:hypothetical protein